LKVLDKSNNISCRDTLPQELHLINNHVDVWLASLDINESNISKLKTILSEDEKIRAERFYSIELKKHFIAARGFQRLILARYLKLKPEELKFQYNTYKKPSLIATHNEKRLCFNLSHSHRTAVYGITLQKAIGVDVEKIRSNLPLEKVARRQFLQPELELFEKSSVSEKIHTFFTLWTRKEALLKALAQGFHFPMKQFDVSGTPEKSVKFLKNSPSYVNNSEWFIRDIETAPGFCAAIATEGQHDVIKLYKASIEQLLAD